MRMKSRAAVLMLAVAYIAAPAWGAVVRASCAQPCVSESSDRSCPGSACQLVASRCELAPLSGPGKRATEESTQQPALVPIRAAMAILARARAPRLAANATWQPSALRLSVVLLI